MKKLLTTSLLALGAIFFVSCSGDGSSSGAHDSFKSRSDYRSTMKVYKNASAYAAANSSNTKIRVDLSDQRAQLVVGPEETVAIDTPVCTGRAGKRTPTGSFPITEMIVNKRSTIFGTTYYRGKRVHGGDRRKYRGPRDKYVGASLPYWLRMTGDGIGMHGSGSVHRSPGSSGCVRTPHDVIPKIYAKVKKGTPVVVVP
jgi:lipoprotein-anchoring transpeptidase ErfK/SrfK